MKKSTLAILLMIVLMGSLFSQKSSDEDWIWGAEKKSEENLENDIIRVNYTKKDARLAMLYSMLLPGAGQFYADRTAITTYIFPVIELCTIAGIIVYTNKGNEKTDKYEKYANKEVITYTLGDGSEIQTTRYDRARQHRVESILRDLNTLDIYESSYFRLDGTNTQHFYEDIGKYPHYVFGWADWYYNFATDASGVDQTPVWHNPDPTNPGWIWRGNYRLWGDNQAVMVDPFTHVASPMRKKYIDLRNDSKDEYAKANALTKVLALNHIVAGLDAIRVTRKVNRGAISDSGLRMNYYTELKGDYLTPMLGVNWKF